MIRYSIFGRATYSAFDSQTNVLWVYDYASQHDLLWPQGEPPDGRRFTETQDGGQSAIHLTILF